MDSIPLIHLFRGEDRSGVFNGKYCWEVYDAATGGPIAGGNAGTPERARRDAIVALATVESSGLYCDDCEYVGQIGLAACEGCCGRR